MKYLNTLVSVVDLAQRNFGTGGRDFANASDYFRNLGRLGQHNGCKCSKRFETCYKNGGIATQKHNIKVSRSTVNIRR